MASAEPPSMPPLGEQSAAGTPGRPTTPHNHGSAGNASYGSKTHQNHYAPYLKHDVKNGRIMNSKDFLREVCGRDPQWMEKRQPDWLKISQNTVIKGLLATFNRPVTREVDRYAPFVALANAILTELGCTDVRFCRNDNTIISGSPASRKPDVVAVRLACLSNSRTIESCDNSGPNQAFWWHEILAFNEFEYTQPKDSQDHTSVLLSHLAESTLNYSSEKSHSSVSPQPGSSKSQKHSIDTSQSATSPKRRKIGRHFTEKQLQCASYALEMLAHGGFRDSVLGMHTKNAEIRLIYYDRSAVIFSKPIRFDENAEDLVCVLDVLAKSKWGICDVITPPTKISTTSEKARAPHFELFSHGLLYLGNRDSPSPDDLELTLGRTLFHQHGIIGRGSCVVKATVISAPPPLLVGTVCAVKLARPARSRVSESVLITDARELARTEGMICVLDYLPNILYTKDLPTTKTQERLAAFFGYLYEDRVHRIVVMDELFPISDPNKPADPNPAELKPAELKIVFRNVFDCYRWLYEKANILHRDLSEGNIMYRRRTDGTVCGVLNDFDLAICTNSNPKPSRQRTGTAPYMAINILESFPTADDTLEAPSPPAHLYRHDLESLFYVLVCVVCDRNHHDIQEWFNRTGLEMAVFKRAFFAKPALPPQSGFDFFSKWINKIHLAFRYGLFAQSNHADINQADTHYDDNTLGGKVSFDIFSDIFKETLVEEQTTANRE